MFETTTTKNIYQGNLALHDFPPQQKVIESPQAISMFGDPHVAYWRSVHPDIIPESPRPNKKWFLAWSN